jgi:hypothetical protein
MAPGQPRGVRLASISLALSLLSLPVYAFSVIVHAGHGSAAGPLYLAALLIGVAAGSVGIVALIKVRQEPPIARVSATVLVVMGVALAGFLAWMFRS